MAKRDGWNAILFSAVECFWIQINHWTAKYSPWNAARRCELVVWKAAKLRCRRWRNVTSWLQDLDTLLEDGKTRTRGWNAAKWWRNANSWLQDPETLLQTTRNAARGRRNVNSCWQDRQALLEDLVVAEWQIPDSTLRACWNITRDHRARLVWSNRDFFRVLQIYLQYLLSYILKFLICIHAGNPRVPPRVLASWPKPCGGKNNYSTRACWIWDDYTYPTRPRGIIVNFNIARVLTLCKQGG